MDDDVVAARRHGAPVPARPRHGDIRLTTSFDDGDLGGILACLHEFGHGLYERQVDPRFVRTPLAARRLGGLHESQSRLWENLVGRRLATWRWFYPRLQEVFPEQLGARPARAVPPRAQPIAPSTRRVEADEVTYSLHVILRFELERAMLAGTVTLADLPEAFDAKMHEYLGVDRRTSSRASSRTSTGRTA